MEYFSAVRAAAVLGVSDKTVRAWITDGTLKAKRLTGSTAKNARYAIPESEIERFQKQLRGNGTSTSPTSTDVTTSTEKFVSSTVFNAFMRKTEEQLHDIQEVELQTLQERIGSLEHERKIVGSYLTEVAAQLADLSKRLSTLELQRTTVAVETPVVATDTDEQPPAQITATEATETLAPKKAGRPAGVKTVISPPVPGAIPDYEFADAHGVNRRTFKDHLNQGKVPAIIVDHPSRPNEKLRWLTPEQQEAALAYWKQHGVATFLPDGWVPLNVFAKEHRIAKTLAEIEDLGRAGHVKGIERGNWITKDGEKIHVALSPEGQKNTLAYFRIR